MLSLTLPLSLRQSEKNKQLWVGLAAPTQVLIREVNILCLRNIFFTFYLQIQILGFSDLLVIVNMAPFKQHYKWVE